MAVDLGKKKENTFFVESKLIKDGYSAFAFNRIRDHQMEALQKIKTQDPDHHCLIAVGFWEPHRLYEVMFLDILFISAIMAGDAKSIKKKELLKWREQGMFLPIKKQILDARLIREKIIYGW